MPTVAFAVWLGQFVTGEGWNGIAQDFEAVHGGVMPPGLVTPARGPLGAARQPEHVRRTRGG